MKRNPKTLHNICLLTFQFILCFWTHQVDADFGKKNQMQAIAVEPLEQWLVQQEIISEKKLLQNVSPDGTFPGVVIASPQDSNPNYYRHWVRDAALTMDVVLSLSVRQKVKLQKLNKLMHDFTTFSRKNQLTDSLVDLGEPIFEVNGNVFSGPWGRPQNDGPALRALVLTRWAKQLLQEGNLQYVRTWLYANELPAHTVIKADLEYISHQWHKANFDLWEESKGDHFYTHMVQRKALLEGAELALTLGDQGAAKWYQDQAQKITSELEKYWEPKKQQIVVTRNNSGGIDYKSSQLDMAIILGVLHGNTVQNYSFSDDRVMKSFNKIVSEFAKLYPINKVQGYPGVALGRYPEDIYAGTDFNGGNPWVLCTLAGAEYLYKRAKQLSQTRPKVAAQLIAQADQFMARVRLHANADGSLSEQINRHTGFMVSARDLTWSYSAFLTALWARKDALKGL